MYLERHHKARKVEVKHSALFFFYYTKEEIEARSSRTGKQFLLCSVLPVNKNEQDEGSSWLRTSADAEVEYLCLVPSGECREGSSSLTHAFILFVRVLTPEMLS